MEKTLTRPIYQRALRFGVTGVGATLVHVIVASSCIEFFNFDAPFANGLAFITATAFSYYVNTRWSFSTTSNLRNVSRFWIASCIGFLLAVSLSAFAQAQGWHYLVGIGLVVSIVPAVSFLLHNLWTYR